MMAASAATGQTTVRPATGQDAGLLLELFGALADYEQLRHELHATEPQIVAALFGERPAAQALIAERGSEPAGYPRESIAGHIRRSHFSSSSAMLHPGILPQTVTSRTTSLTYRLNIRRMRMQNSRTLSSLVRIARLASPSWVNLSLR